MTKNLLPPGFKDDISEQANLEHKLKNTIIDLFQLNGYELVKPPLIEYANTKNNNDVFVIKEKKELKDYIIRNDLTMQVARLASVRLRNKPRPLKLCYYGEVVRKKGSMLRPERQFLQVGAECIGEDSFTADVEILDLAYQSLIAVGIKNISVELSSFEFLNYLINKNKQKNNQNKILSFIRKKDLKNCLKYIDSSMYDYTKNLFSCTGNLNDKKNILKKIAVDKKTIIATDNLINIYNNFLLKYPDATCVLDLTDSNYFDYHTGIKFTFYGENVRGEIARGGRYISNKSNLESSTGFTCYMDTIIRATSYEEEIKKILIPFNTEIKVKKELFKKGYVVETYFGNLSYIKKAAQEKGIKACLIKNKIIFINNR